MNTLSQSTDDECIAVIGINCRFPGASDKNRFWANLVEGQMSRKTFTKNDVLASGVPESVLNNPDYVSCGYTIDGIDTFDADFFGYSPEEARLIDPQQRLYLQANWAALEDAGYDPETYDGNIGVFAGSRMSSYMFSIQEKLRVMGSTDFLQTLMGNDKDYLTSRISYKLNLKGPSIAVQTACSSSLVAVHMACESLLSNECDMALAGGVAISVPNTRGYIYQKGMLFSPDGVCRPFDVEAGGTVFGDGLGVVVLKQMSKAVDDGDHIYALIRGTAVNNDGASKISFTAPSVNGQMAVIDEALAVSGIDPATISYIEAHSIATPMGDLIEFESLRRVHEAFTGKKQYCAIGSVKSNIGHLESAAGIASFIKTVLMLENKRLVPSINFRKPNSEINFESSPYYVQTKSEPWIANGTPLRAGVNSFGIGGTNAHVILEAPPSQKASPAHHGKCCILPLSAATESALAAMAQNYLKALKEAEGTGLADICMTAATGRRSLEYRLALTGCSVKDMHDHLEEYTIGRPSNGTHIGKTTPLPPRIAFLFTGQGSQYAQMGQSLYNTVDPFREHIDRCGHILSQFTDFSLHELLFSENEAIHNTTSAQLALFSVEYALASTLIEWGVRPELVMGHSLGEYVAAVTAGVISLEDGLRLIVERARLMGNAPGDGVMYAVFAHAHTVETILSPFKDRLTISAYNGPEHTVVSGDSSAADAFCAMLDNKGIFYKKLAVSHAFHSPLMKPILPAFSQAAGLIAYHAPSIPLVSNVTGKVIHAAEIDAAYWTRHMESPVNFMAGMETLEENMIDIYVEVGPEPVLTGMGRECTGSPERVKWLSCLSRRQPGYDTLMEMVAELFVSGAPVNWNGMNRQNPFKRVPLPTYPFENKRFWIESTDEAITPSSIRPSLQENSGHGKEDSASSLLSKTRSYLKQIYSEASRIPPLKISLTERLENYGINSLVITKLNVRLDKDFGELSKIIFFEFRTLEEVANYLIRNKKKELAAYFGNVLAAPPPRIEIPPTVSLDHAGGRDGKNRVKVDSSGDIAIIGISGKYPMAETLEEFWHNISSGKDCITEIPEDRWDYKPFFNPDPDHPGAIYCKWGGFIEDIDKFDPIFFNISPAEAMHIDPQERLFLQMSWEALESANHSRELLNTRYHGNVGVFAGVMYGEYQYFGVEETLKGNPLALHASYGSIANRVSYFFDFNGPSMAVDTFCSSSLTAIHMAVESINSGDCEIALAGGVNLNIHPNKYLMISQLKMASPTGRCKPFGKEGDGFVPGEGGGIVVLKRRENAEEDRDNILAIIKSTATNHGGRTSGYSVPNPGKQAELIQKALKKGRIDPRTISYIEAHGTGTALGDPVEVGGLTKAFEIFTDEKQFSAIGSVKSNIGHLEAASGIAAVTKVVLQMKQKKLAPSLHVHELNPNINFQRTPFYLQKELTEWNNNFAQTNGETVYFPRRAGVSSFGAGGANAHVIIEEYARPADVDGYQMESPCVFVLSAKNARALKDYARKMLVYLKPGTGEAFVSDNPADIAYTLQTGREMMKERLAILFDTTETLHRLLEQFCSGKNDRENLFTGSINDVSYEDELPFTANGQSGFLENALKNKKTDVLADLWCKGVSINWELLYPGDKPKKIQLPTYPFSKETYWFKPKPVRNGGKPVMAGKSRNLSKNDTLCFHPEWVECALNVQASSPFPGDLIIFDTDMALFEKLSGDRQETGAQTLLVSAGKKFLKKNSHHFHIDPENPSDYELLLKEAGLNEASDLAVVHNWSGASFSMKAEDLENQMDESVYSLFFIHREIGKRYPKKKIRYLYLYHEDTVMQPVYSAVGGFARSLHQENSNIGFKIVSCDERLSGSVIDELNKFSEGCREIKYTKGTRYETRLRRTRRAIGKHEGRITHNGVYVITGGGGGIGQIIADCLASKYRIKLVLCGRKECSAAIEEFMSAIRRKGSDIVYIAADVSVKTDVDALIRKTRDRFGRISGVFHCAGIVNDSLCSGKTKEMFENVIRPKIFGTVYLDDALKNESCDFLFLFSSIVAVIGNTGQCDYSYANRFMNDYSAMRFNNSQGHTIVSVGWPLWENGGMRISESNAGYFEQKTGMKPIKNQDAFGIIEDVIGKPVPALSVMHGDGEKINEFVNTVFFTQESADVHGCGYEQRTDRPEDILCFLRATISDITRIPEEQIDDTATFPDMGVNSIMLMKTTRRIESRLSIKIYPNEMLVHDSITKLFEFLIKETARHKSAVTKRADERKKPVIYIFSTPRSGSTLLRVMLMGHSKIFAPPELHLLQFESLGQRYQALENENTLFLREGFIESIKELKGVSPQDALRMMQELEDNDLSVKGAYAFLQELCKDCYLVDKSPTYALNAGTLLNAEAMDPNSFYIFLIRNPMSVMESFARNGFDRMMGINEDPWVYAEKIWCEMNSNIRSFLEDIPEARKLFIRYEDLVKNPEPLMKNLCSKLHLDFEKSLINPYEGHRMINGLHKESISIGDPNFLNHKTIDPHLATSWEKHQDKLSLLKPETIDLAGFFGYQTALDKAGGTPTVPKMKQPVIELLPAQKEIFKRYGNKPHWGIASQIAFITEEPIDLDKFQNALETLIKSYTVLQLKFPCSNSASIPQIEKNAHSNVYYENISDYNNEMKKEFLNGAETELATRINLESAPLLRVKLLETGMNEYVLVCVISMLIADGRTFEIFIENLFHHYHHGASASVINDDNYLGYIDTIKRIEASDVPVSHTTYWKSQMPPKRITLPFESGDKRPLVGSESVFIVTRTFEELGIDNRKTAGNLFYFFSAGLYSTLKQYTEDADPVVFHRHHRRNLTDYGMFVNSTGRFAGDFPLSLSLSNSGDDRNSVEAFKEKFNQVPLQGLTYELLKNRGDIPSVENGCLLLNFQPDTPRLKGLINIKWKQYEDPSVERKYLMDLIVRVNNRKTTIISKYSKNTTNEEKLDEFIVTWIEKTTSFIARES